ncbi:hypothetical protein ACQP0C_22320 [Nocardia sp. CA-129566]|uniref:hypothetical protein n=1 Tax=Nocardia sp. CA-129566 TaxID=3239976 RepID=UPI003D966266
MSHRCSSSPTRVSSAPSDTAAARTAERERFAVRPDSVGPPFGANAARADGLLIGLGLTSAAVCGCGCAPGAAFPVSIGWKSLCRNSFRYRLIDASRALTALTHPFHREATAR